MNKLRRVSPSASREGNLSPRLYRSKTRLHSRATLRPSPTSRKRKSALGGSCCSLNTQTRRTELYKTAYERDQGIIPDELNPSTTNRVLARTLALKRAALGAQLCSYLLHRKASFALPNMVDLANAHAQADLARAIEPALQAMRVWTRALSNISRLSAPEFTAQKTRADTFQATASDPNEALSEFPAASRKRHVVQSNGAHGALSWQLANVSRLRRFRTGMARC